MDRAEVTKLAKQFIKMKMLEEDINFVELQKMMQESGYNYSLDAIRQKVGRGSYDARFLFEFADALDLEVKLLKKSD